MQVKTLPVKVRRGARISPDARKAINEENLFNLGSVFGSGKTIKLIERDPLRLALTGDMVAITIFGHGNMQATPDDERLSGDKRLWRMHRV